MAGKPRSCTSCRQAKVACDARNKPPNTPCTRCIKNQFQCRFDKNFKRILTRKLTANLTKELHQVRVSQHVAERSKSSPMEMQWQEPEALLANAPLLFTNDTESHPDFCIGNIAISPRTIVELVQQYIRSCLHSKLTAADLHEASGTSTTSMLLLSSPSGLWYHHPKHYELYEQLLSPHQELLRPFSNTAIQSIHEIHVLLLLCLWPIPKRPESLSPTWNYIGLAVNACMQLDLHRTVLPDPVESQSKFFGEATFLGFLPPLSSHLHLKRSRKAIEEANDHLLPGSRPKFAIYETICNYSVVLEDIEDASAQFSLVETFNGSLDTIRQTYVAEWNTDVDVLLQYAKLNLNATALVRLLPQTEARDSHYSTNLQTLIIRGSEASSRLICHVKSITSSALDREGQPSQKTMSIYYPRFYFEALLFATVFIFRTSYLRPSISQPQGNSAIEGLIEVYNIYQLFPHHQDVLGGAEFLQRLIRYTSSEETPCPPSPLASLTATNRLGASIVWDTLQHFRRASGSRHSADQEEERQEQRELHNTIADTSLLMPNTLVHHTSGGAGGLALQGPVNLDLADLDLCPPTFDIFGLNAGEQIMW
ncbi:hypothetical protein HD806DRAFT_543675 [Xylariaceae sp. AK1471]|nr:hypothetical protein HD806DRAFT_543675 [Xylariaceae sp. AK1471]